jgi:hypothetical protein
MSRFRSVGRIAFARGNSSWAKTFNQNVMMARSGASFSSYHRVMTAAMTKFSTLAFAAEVPAGSGFAEQFRDMSPFNLSQVVENTETELETDSEVEVSTEPAVDTRINKMSNLSQSCGYNFSQKTWSLLRRKI